MLVYYRSIMDDFDALYMTPGRRGEIPCRSTKPGTVHWGLYSTNSEDHPTISVYGKLINGYNKTMELNGQNLVILNVQPKNRGLYVCIEDNGIGNRHFTSVSVTGNLFTPNKYISIM